MSFLSSLMARIASLEAGIVDLGASVAEAVQAVETVKTGMANAAQNTTSTTYTAQPLPVSANGGNVDPMPETKNEQV